MEGPYYDNYAHMFALDVYLNYFNSIRATGVDIEIEFDNSAIVIDHTLTEASAYSGLTNLNCDFDYFTNAVEVTGAITPFCNGPVFTTSSHLSLFTIYFSIPPDQCVDFNFGDRYYFIVSFNTYPTPSYNACNGGISTCSYEELCTEGFELSGMIESVNTCEDSYNHGVPGVFVGISEINQISAFGCESKTDEYGEYGCEVVGGRDYRITPVNDYDIDCGLSSLDIDLLRDHILGRNCLDYKWQIIAGDVNHSGTLSTLDLADIQEAILYGSGDFESWTFIPATDYNLIDDPDGCDLDVPSYNTYLDVPDVDDDIENLDFVGIKMGDENASCTDCYDSGFVGEDVWTRSQPIEIVSEKLGLNTYSLSFGSDLVGLKILMVSIKCEEEPKILYNALDTKKHFITNFRDGIYYISYVSLNMDGESFKAETPFLILQGKFQRIELGYSKFKNELISEEYHSEIQMQEKIGDDNFIYPNPATNEIFARPIGNADESTDLLIFDLFGHLILTTTIQESVNRIDINLVPGLYLYKLRTSQLETTGRLIIN